MKQVGGTAVQHHDFVGIFGLDNVAIESRASDADQEKKCDFEDSSVGL